jgi:hypothetical protein
MASLKHVGRVKNTGRRCVVVFRQMYDEKGHVIDEHNCLVFESETLPDAEHQDLMRIIEGELAQSTGDLYNVLVRARLGNGVQALTWLVKSERLRKFPTDNIELTPDSRTTLSLETLNKIVKMQKAGASQAEVENLLRNDTDMPPRQAESITANLTEASVPVDTQTDVNDVLDDSTLAANFLAQAKLFETQAKDLRAQAVELDPSLKPKRGRPASTKSSANSKA